MQDLTYKQIQKIDKSATKKLLKYISKEIQDESILDKLEFFYPDFGEQKHTLAFNVWISIDFMGKDGKTFIEKFLEEKSGVLTEQEKDILIERNKSNISLFEVLDIDGEFIKVVDLLQNKSYKLWEPELAHTISIGDFALARVGNLLGYFTFVGDISYLPSSIKSMFLEEVFIDFNRLRLNFQTLTMKEYLKKYSINLYKIYTNCIFEAMEMDEDIVSVLYDELDEFEAYLGLKVSKSIVKRYIANLIDFFEYYLADEDLTLYDLDQVDFHYFFKDAIKEGFIVSQEDLNSYIATFKNYLGFLSNKDSDYKEVYKELLNISKTRFDFMNQLKLVKSPFVIDKELSNIVSDFLNEDAISLIMDYDKFMLYVLDKPLDLTEKNKYIKRKNLLEMNKILELSNHVDKDSPNQKDFPIIHMFYKLSLNLGLLSINGNKLSVSNKGTNYLRLRDEDKYALFFQHIWKSEFISELCDIENINILEKSKKDLMLSLSSLSENTNYEIGSILPKFSNNLKFFFASYIYLQYLGIIKCNLYPNYEIKLTSLGKTVLNFLESRNNRKHECSVINLESFKKSR
ncbi:hypothetical protein CIW83_17325 [Tissierella sp. P1]|uniref:hypothetical protein n=1 Tax=Tissierella sp. P1 TaxID=1280483 RepID=UPI000BA0D7D6|nr:hypothetical protein [Tissierella sp. P1]OZV10929.1 hypothetical protein CIW83_17325 [Tissierella sp. P1]